VSQLNVDTIKKADGTGNLSVPAETGTVVTTASPSLGRRNMAQNGDMRIAQRGTSLSLAHDGPTNGYVADRFQFIITGTADSLDGTLAQVPDAPDGYSNSLKWTTGTPETTAADEAVYVQQKIEAQNLQHLGYGSASASSLTVSFWVKSSQTGTFAMSLYEPDGSRNIGTTYTIDAANTWEQKTISFAGDTSGTINNDNGNGLQAVWHIAAGSDFNSADNTSWGAHASGRWGYGHVQNGVTETASATFYITGVQLEVGSVASTYEHRSYGEELALCKRYYRVLGKGLQGDVAGSTFFELSTTFDIEMRSAPDLVLLTSTPSITEMGAGGRTGSGSVISGSTSSADGVVVAINGFSGMTVSNGAYSTTASLISCSAEL